MTESTTARQELIPHFRQSVIRNARVVVAGAGATGNEVLKNLALLGCGYVFVTDMDHISTSNRSRTVLYSGDDVGKRKAATAAERFCAMNVDHGTADVFDGDLCHGVGEGVIRHADIVIGCVDNEQTRLYISHLCQLLGKPYIDTGIGGFNWNVFTASGREGCACYACTMQQKEEERAMQRIRNSCDVTRKKELSSGHVQTIGIAGSGVGALAVLEAVKVLHDLHVPDNALIQPRYGWISCFSAEANWLKNSHYSVRSDCNHHDSYDRHGGVRETPMSAHWKLHEVLDWVKEQYGREYAIALYKDSEMADRSFVTRACCKHCGTPMEVYRPQPLQEEDLLCESCRQAGKPALYQSGAVEKSWFSREDEPRLQQMTLLELGIPRLHIVEFAPTDEEGESLYLELTGDMAEVMPHLPEREEQK